MTICLACKKRNSIEVDGDKFVCQACKRQVHFNLNRFMLLALEGYLAFLVSFAGEEFLASTSVGKGVYALFYTVIISWISLIIFRYIVFVSKEMYLLNKSKGWILFLRLGILILIICLSQFFSFLQTIGLAAPRDTLRGMSQVAETQFTVPGKVGLYFIPSPEGNNLPALQLTVFAGNGCDQAGNLQINKKLISNQPNIYVKGGRTDILEIRINGYEFLQPAHQADMDCPGVLIESRATIELDEFMTSQSLQLQIILNDQGNTFDLNQYEDVVYLNPVAASNIISWNPGENMPDRSQRVGFMTEAFRSRLAQIRLNGGYAHKSDLATRLREYIRQAGYEPLDEKLQGFPRMNPLGELIVFVPSDKEIPVDFKIIGKVSYNEIPGGDKIINVGIVKKTVFNPFFVRY